INAAHIQTIIATRVKVSHTVNGLRVGDLFLDRTVVVHEQANGLALVHIVGKKILLNQPVYDPNVIFSGSVLAPRVDGGTRPLFEASCRGSQVDRGIT